MKLSYNFHIIFRVIIQYFVEEQLHEKLHEKLHEMSITVGLHGVIFMLFLMLSLI